MTPRRNRTIGLALSFAVLLATSPVAAGEIAPTPGDLRLHLEEAYLSQQPESTSAADSLEADTPSTPSVSFALEPLTRDAHLAEAAAEAQAERGAMPQRSGFGRWLKKRWWVPVLVAVAVGLAVSDDDDQGEDDDD